MAQIALPNGVRRGRQQAMLTPVAWHPDRQLDLAEWIRQGDRLGTIGRGAAWWIGDWVNYGNAKFGEKYSRAARITGYDIQSLMNKAYVASRFHISRRREDLSWSHHAEVAPLSVNNQNRWLEIAANDRLSVRGLREELRSWRAQLKLEEGPADPADPAERPGLAAPAAPEAVLCPRCGYELGDGPHQVVLRADEPDATGGAPAARRVRR